MRFGSVCSGIEAASVAFGPLGWEAAWFSEIEPFPCGVLAHHFPGVPNLGDMNALPEMILSGAAEAPDMLCGGTPCQAFSFAGKRQSLDDERGNLSLTFCEVADAIDAVRNKHGRDAVVVFWENVPGVLSTKDNAFGCFLGRLVGADAPLSSGAGRWPRAGVVAGPKRKAAWRVLDAQYFGVPQRRRRVFAVASARNDIDPAKILFECARVRGHFEESREARESVAGYVESCFGAFREDTIAGTAKASGGALGGGSETPIVDKCYDMTHACDVIRENGVVPTLNARMGTGGNQIPIVLSHPQGAGMRSYSDGKTGALTATKSSEPCYVLAENTIGRRPETGGNGNGWQKGVSYTLNATGVHGVCVPIDTMNIGERKGGSNGLGIGVDGDPSYTLTKGHAHAIATERVVRKLTPIECERLQGFPDNWTKIPYRGKSAEECPDSPRYKAIGNSWAVPCVAWIGERIKDALNKERDF